MIDKQFIGNSNAKIGDNQLMINILNTLRSISDNIDSRDDTYDSQDIRVANRFLTGYVNRLHKYSGRGSVLPELVLKSIELEYKHLLD